MHRVIDAMNVIGSRPDGWWRDRSAAIERLVAHLDRWAAEVDDDVTVVLEQPPSRPLPAEQIEIVWAPQPGPNSADKEILRRLDGWLAEGEVTVVTSDRDLAERAQAKGAAAESAAAFRDRLDAL
ncbi:MAG: NYN domain-containing protein [Solirubrobacterales bacterium]